MSAIPVQVVRSRLDADWDVKLAHRLARLMDQQFSIGGVRFGWDALIGLAPIVGDTAAVLIGLFPLYVARRRRLGWALSMRMLLNLLVDWAIGLVPLAGDLADVGFKANVRNVRLLERAMRKGGYNQT
ncbi:MAG: DUF4112 domain-containing protein [Phycisphaerales bacterium]|jgi:hypothetical protein|nr:DUF4112 domain-containing protein [Phycisphaerales bacterium]